MWASMTLQATSGTVLVMWNGINRYIHSKVTTWNYHISTSDGRSLIHEPSFTLSNMSHHDTLARSGVKCIP